MSKNDQVGLDPVPEKIDFNISNARSIFDGFANPRKTLDEARQEAAGEAARNILTALGKGGALVGAFSQFELQFSGPALKYREAGNCKAVQDKLSDL